MFGFFWFFGFFGFSEVLSMSDLMSLALVLLDVTLGLLISKHMGLGLDWPAWFFGLLKI